MEILAGIFSFIGIGLFIWFAVWGFKKIMKTVKGFEAKNLGSIKLQAIINGSGVKFTCLDCGKNWLTELAMRIKLKKKIMESLLFLVYVVMP